MKFRDIAVIIFFSFGLMGCQTTGTLYSLTYTGQKQVVRNGQQAILSDKKNIVSVSPVSDVVDDGGRASFLVLVTNQSKTDFLISANDIQASSLNLDSSSFEVTKDKSQGKADEKPYVPEFETATNAKSYLASYSSGGAVDMPLKVYSYEELKKEEELRATVQAISIALGGVGQSMQASNAGYQSGYGSFNTYSSYSGPVYGTYNYSGYNYAAAQAARNAAQAQTDAQIANASAQHSENMERLALAIFKDHTLMPGETHGGVVQVQLPSFANSATSIPVILNVHANKERHDFLFKIKKNAQN